MRKHCERWNQPLANSYSGISSFKWLLNPYLSSVWQLWYLWRTNSSGIRLENWSKVPHALLLLSPISCFWLLYPRTFIKALVMQEKRKWRKSLVKSIKIMTTHLAGKCWLNQHCSSVVESTWPCWLYSASKSWFTNWHKSSLWLVSLFWQHTTSRRSSRRAFAARKHTVRQSYYLCPTSSSYLASSHPRTTSILAMCRFQHSCCTLE